MKTIVLAVTGTLMAVVLLSSCDKGSMLNTETISTDSTVRLEAAGVDLRVYEFTPQTAPNTGLVCFDKE